MRHLRLLLFLISIVFYPLIAFCNDAFSGLVFRAYEYSKDERTSFTIPSSEHTLRLKNYLSLSFDLKIRAQGEHFGYVCRIIIGDQSDINLILVNPASELPYLCFIKDKEYLGKISPESEMDIYEWNRITIELEVKGNVLYVKGNDIVIAKDETPPENRSVKICFGANNQAQFSTSDVAPMILKNVKVGLLQGTTNYVWPLKEPVSDVLFRDESEKLTASIVNPEWNISRHLHWEHTRTIRFSSKTYPVLDNVSGAFYFVSQHSVTKLDALSNTVHEYPFTPSIDVERLTNQFIFIPDSAGRGHLIYYDVEKPIGEHLSSFDFDAKQWSVPIKRSRQSTYSHHNKFFSVNDTSIVQLFGYGFHQYMPEMNRISLSGDVIRDTTPEIPPRYLSAIAMADSVVYIYGGMGNELGKQEYGVTFYRDLYKLNLKDYSLEKCWGIPSGAYNEVAAPTLVVDSTGKHAKGLFFTPLRFQSGLVMKDLNLTTGELITYGDTIPFTFLDVSSFVELMYIPAQKRYCAVTVHQSDAHNYEANIYSIAYPVFSFSTSTSERANNVWLIIGIAVLGIGVGGVLCYKFSRSKRTVTSEVAKETVESGEKVDPRVFSLDNTDALESNVSPGIHLLNGFQVVDSGSKDITGKFTPIMRQLLSVIILYTNYNNKGISNIKLKELLWFDKSEESFSNNRSVNMRKIRLLLENIGDIEISSDNGYWRVLNKGGVYIDYIAITELVKKLTPLAKVDEHDLSCLLQLASFGQLLPNMQFDWLDEFKAGYSDSIINLLSKLRDSEQLRQNDKMKILIANCILKFDSLDEDSVRVKCLSLINLKRIGLAHATFEQFTREYKLILNETYNDSFEQFVATS